MWCEKVRLITCFWLGTGSRSIRKAGRHRGELHLYFGFGFIFCYTGLRYFHTGSECTECLRDEDIHSRRDLISSVISGRYIPHMVMSPLHLGDRSEPI